MSAYPLEPASAESLGFHRPALARLEQIINAHIAAGRYPGAQFALARHGKLAMLKSFGRAALAPERALCDDTLFLMFSNTKVITAAGIWALVEDGALSFTDRIAKHIPEFAQHGKGEITISQLLSHRAGFPTQDVPSSAWTDHALMRERVCAFTLEWTPGSRLVYHQRSAHWTAATLIEALTGTDYREFLRKRITEPLGIADDLFIGVPDAVQPRAATMYVPTPDGALTPLALENTPAYRAAGIPSSGGFTTARACVALYQMMLGGGRVNGVRLFSPRLIQYVTRNVTGETFDQFMGMPMHRGLGTHQRGTTESIRGLGSLASPNTFGHGGAGNSYCWGDPDSGVSFAYLSNCRIPDPWHSERLEIISNLVHTAID
ncbi:MAG: serine hydrolase domain-containing protein [Burkholderiales bacterium]